MLRRREEGKWLGAPTSLGAEAPVLAGKGPGALLQHRRKETTPSAGRLPPRLVKAVRGDETYRAPVSDLRVPEPGLVGAVTLGLMPG